MLVTQPLEFSVGALEGSSVLLVNEGAGAYTVTEMGAGPCSIWPVIGEVQIAGLPGTSRNQEAIAWVLDTCRDLGIEAEVWRKFGEGNTAEIRITAAS